MRTAAANRPLASQNDTRVTKRGDSMKSIRTQVAIRIIKLAAALLGLALVVAPWPLTDRLSNEWEPDGFLARLKKSPASLRG